jgi:hypothetical protein
MSIFSDFEGDDFIGFLLLIWAQYLRASGLTSMQYKLFVSSWIPKVLQGGLASNEHGKLQEVIFDHHYQMLK